MANLNEMSSKELKALGKEHHVKDWWTLNKAALISALSEILKEEEPQEQEPEIVEIETPVVETVEETPEIKKPNLHIKEITYAGKTQTIREWANELNMPWPTLYDRINRNGWTVEEALCTPLGERRKRK